MPAAKLPAIPAPDGLSDRATALWHAVVPARAVSAGRRALVEEALRALDRADEARALVDAEGLCTTTATTKAVHVHPAAKIEREARQMFAKIWSGMHLEFSAREDGRSF